MRFNRSTKRGRLYAVRPIADRFWPKVRPSDDPDACLIWTGGRQGQGYGMIWSGPPDNKVIEATHVALRFVGVIVLPGQCVRHTCDNPPCVNVRHLIVGTKGENNRDMWAKGRANLQRPGHQFRRGEQVGTSKLTAAIVTDMRQRYASSAVTMLMLAIEYGVSEATVYQVIHRVRWAHVP